MAANTNFSFYWFDYETFGTSPLWDRPAQFAGLRTDAQLNPLGEPLMIYCRPSPDYLPDPQACRVTGITPQKAAEHGLAEIAFIQAIQAELGAPGTCFVGYNNIRFDDEFTRHTLYRNLLEPYAHEYQQGASRWDLLDVVRLTRALRPEGIQWPVNDDGSPSNRLEHLSAANGLEHSHAHDALSDVVATIAVARLIKQKQPRLYAYALNHRRKADVAQLLNVKDRKPAVHVSGMVPATQGHTSIVVPLLRHPVNTNGIIVLDLRTDPNELKQLDADVIAKRVFTPANNETNTRRLHLRTVHINRCPVVVPMATLRSEDAARLGIDRDLQLERAQAAAHLSADTLQAIGSAMTSTFDNDDVDVDGALYRGFFNPTDRRLMNDVVTADGQGLERFTGLFSDPRLDELLWRFRARNYPHTLTRDEMNAWQSHCHQRLRDTETPTLTFAEFQSIIDSIDWSPDELELRSKLTAYASELNV